MIELHFSVNCPYCGEAVSGRCENYISNISLHERETGSETEYKIECDEYDCPECRKPFSLRGPIWEYSEGAENLNDVVAKPVDGIDDDALDGESNG